MIKAVRNQFWIDSRNKNFFPDSIIWNKIWQNQFYPLFGDQIQNFIYMEVNEKINKNPVITF